jgi:pantoate--beta-alanine ligase
MSVPAVVSDPAALAEVLAPHRAAGGRVALVPTMGALHDGHLTLVEAAAREADAVVVSVFVNPTQFDDPTDLAAYGADLAADVETLGRADVGADRPLVVYAPTVATMYPHGPAGTVRVHVPELTAHLCGPHRPGHFDGVATVVTKLLLQVRPDVAVFGRKDFQQLAVVRRVVDDLDLAVAIVGVPTVREADGLARSSRNARLGPSARANAAAVPRALAAGVAVARAGAPAGRVRAAVRSVLDAQAGTVVEYVEVTDVDGLVPVDDTAVLDRPRLLAIAVRVPAATRDDALEGAGPATVRLIDNVVLGDRDDEDRLLTAVGDA